MSETTDIVRLENRICKLEETSINRGELSSLYDRMDRIEDKQDKIFDMLGSLKDGLTEIGKSLIRLQTEHKYHCDIQEKILVVQGLHKQKLEEHQEAINKIRDALPTAEKARDKRQDLKDTLDIILKISALAGVSSAVILGVVAALVKIGIIVIK